MLGDGPIGWAAERTGAAFDAVHDAEGLGGGNVVRLHRTGNRRRVELHGTGAHAAAAVDAGLGRILEYARVRKQQQAGGGLGGADLRGGHVEAHHRAAGDDLRGRNLFAARARDEVGIARAGGRKDVLGVRDRVARDGGHAPDERLAVDDRLGDGGGRAHVLDDTAHLDRQSALGHDAAHGGVDLVLFGALWIENGQDDDLDVALDVGERLFHGGDGLGLVGLDGDAHGRLAQNLAHDLHAGADARRLFHHHAAVGGEIGFALGTVQDEEFAALVRRRGELDDGGEARAAHAADAGVVDARAQVFNGGRLPVQRGKGGGVFLRLVGFKDYAVRHAARRPQALFDALDRAARRRVDGHRDEAVTLADELAAQDVVARLDEAFGGRAEMLAHGNGEGLGNGQLFDRLAGGQFLVVVGVDPAMELE